MRYSWFSAISWLLTRIGVLVNSASSELLWYSLIELVWTCRKKIRTESNILLRVEFDILCRPRIHICSAVAKYVCQGDQSKHIIPGDRSKFELILCSEIILFAKTGTKNVLNSVISLIGYLDEGRGQFL